MGQPVSAGGGVKAAMLFENRNARLDARVTDIYARAGDKTTDPIIGASAERAAQPRPE
jgi:hypothetical protein